MKKKFSPRITLLFLLFYFLVQVEQGVAEPGIQALSTQNKPHQNHPASEFLKRKKISDSMKWVTTKGNRIVEIKQIKAGLFNHEDKNDNAKVFILEVPLKNHFDQHKELSNKEIKNLLSYKTIYTWKVLLPKSKGGDWFQLVREPMNNRSSIQKSSFWVPENVTGRIYSIEIKAVSPDHDKWGAGQWKLKLYNKNKIVAQKDIYIVWLKPKKSFNITNIIPLCINNNFGYSITVDNVPHSDSIDFVFQCKDTEGKEFARKLNYPGYLSGSPMTFGFGVEKEDIEKDRIGSFSIELYCDNSLIDSTIFNIVDCNK